MTRSDEQLEDILDSMIYRFGAPTPEGVRETVTRHPALKAAILEFAAGWQEEDALPRAASLPSVREVAIAATAQQMFAAGLTQPAVARQLSDLAKRAGTSLDELAVRAMIPSSVLHKLNGGRISPATIGTVLPVRLARLLDATAEAVASCWSGASVPQAAMAFLGPANVTQMSLRAALIEAGADPDLIEELHLPR